MSDISPTAPKGSQPTPSQKQLEDSKQQHQELLESFKKMPSLLAIIGKPLEKE